VLGRDSAIVYAAAARQWVSGKTVLVTGAGGSIGSEIVRQVRSLGPDRVIMLDHDEGALHALQFELEGHGLLNDENIVLADIRDQLVIYDLFDQYQPDVVFHAAAHKHLPLIERFPGEGIKTNVLGTWNVARASARCGVRTLVNISTDKAAAPTCVLGATKRVAEQLCASMAGRGLNLASVRFGNVLGSRGSLLPTLHHQLSRGLPVMITDQDATRYFMTIPEAASLVVEAGVMALAGETFVLDMGEPVRILDVMKRYADALGFQQPEVIVTGLRSGEKRHEVLTDGGEVQRPTDHPRISAIIARAAVSERLGVAVERLERRIGVSTANQLITLLDALLPIRSAAEDVA
jgi:FlaA1/EpsC-like NDP-sugar epimerase